LYAHRSHILDCGSTHFKDQGIRDALKKRLPDDKEIDSMIFGAIDEYVLFS